MSVLQEIINSDFETKDDLVVKLGEAIQEEERVSAELVEANARADKAEAEVASLKTKNLELLSMIPTVVEEATAEVVEEDEEVVTLDDIFKEDKERVEED